MAHRRRTGKRAYAAAGFLASWAAQDEVWPLFDGWCASQNVDPLELPWDRCLNLVYFFATRNATKEKKQEFDAAMSKQVTADTLRKMALTRKNAVRATQTAEESQGVPKGTDELRPRRAAKLPPRPAGWGDAETATRQSLIVAQSLKVGDKQRSSVG